MLRTPMPLRSVCVSELPSGTSIRISTHDHRTAASGYQVSLDYKKATDVLVFFVENPTTREKNQKDSPKFDAGFPNSISLTRSITERYLSYPITSYRRSTPTIRDVIVDIVLD